MEYKASQATDLVCIQCGVRFEPTARRVLCDCGGWLEQCYDFGDADLDCRPDGSGHQFSATLWRYRRFLPVLDVGAIVSLGEGGTPLVPMRSLSDECDLEILVKDEGPNPTGSFKARGASVGVSRLAELGWKALGMPTVGSGGSAWSAYAARAGLKMRVGLPELEGLPALAALEPPMYGADLRTYAAEDAPSAFRAFGATLDDDTLYTGAFAEPYRVEGEKTIMYELCEQLGWRAPDVVIWPTGGAAGLVGLAKGLGELRAAGWINGPDTVTLIAAQHADCPPIAAALRDGLSEPEAYEASGVAPGVWIGRPAHGRAILERVRREARGYGATANDDEILETMRHVARTEGLLLSPEGALAVAAARSLRKEGYLTASQTVVCVNSATGLRYPHLLS